MWGLVPIHENGRCTHLIGVSRDVTERKLEGKALRAEKARAENYLNIAEAIIVGLDREGRVTLLNKKGYEVTGYTPGSLTGKSWIEACMNPARHDVLRRTFREAVMTGTMPPRMVTYLYTRDGERRLVRWSNSIVFDQDNEVAGVLASGEDVTERREAEKSMIASQRLLAAGEIAAAVAHDFNNALQGILGSLELALLDTDVGVGTRSLLETASGLANDAAERIRMLQRLDASAQAGNWEPVDINELVREVVVQTQPMWRDRAQKEGREISVEVELGEDVQRSLGQPAELRSVLFNLVKNSIEALPRGGEIRIATRFDSGANVVTVSDDGEGMDDVTRERVFRPFFSTKGFDAGRGLGLSASYAVARAHHGEVCIRHSAPGRGTTMELRLPVVESVAGPEATPDVAADPGPLRVLWVDDDDAVRQVAQGYLDSLGHLGQTVGSGEVALERLATEHFDVVVTDLGMPGMNGFELAQRVADMTYGRVPVLALTGWGETISRAEQQRFDIRRVLSKPISVQALQRALAEVRVS